jgi:hypothetical protein
VLTRTTRRPRPMAALASGVLVLAGVVATTPPAHAAARVSASNDRGTATADDDRPTTFTVRGSGFQSVAGGFGGVYVAFGWVRDPAGGGWRPSRGGITGRDYRYVPDSESGENAGYLRFVAFPGSSTAGEAQAVMSAEGSFAVSLSVPGPTFRAVDRSGAAVDVDCRRVTCGIVTFGAHGVKNARNETFTPVRFGEVYADDTGTAGAPGEADPAGSSDPADEASASGPSTGTTTTGGTTSGAVRSGTGASRSGQDGASGRRGRPEVVTERQTARAGQALAFTGRGFEPGEQVLALLDDGVVALGPLPAGNAGEVAGVMALPTDLAAGTHQLRLVGAASGARPSERFPVRAAAATPPVEESAADPVAGEDSDVAALAFVAASAVALLASLALLVVRLRRRVAPSAPATAGAEVVA